MIFQLDEHTVRQDAAAFAALFQNRQSRFDAAPDAPAQAENGTDLLQKRLRPGPRRAFVVSAERTANGLYILTLRAQDGAAPVYRPGQAARVYCPAVSYPLFFFGRPEPEAGLFRLAVSPDTQGEAHAFLASLSVGDGIVFRAPVGQFYYLPPRDRGELVFLTDPSGLPAAAAFAAAIPENGDVPVAFYACGCQKEPFFDGRFLEADPAALPPVPETARLFIAGGAAFCKTALARYAPRRARVAVTDPPRRGDATGKTFRCAVVTAEGERTIPCSADRTLLAAFEAAGIPVPAGCAEGNCGFCRCVLRSGSVTEAPDPCGNPLVRTADAERHTVHSCRVFPDSDLTVLL